MSFEEGMWYVTTISSYHRRWSVRQNAVGSNGRKVNFTSEGQVAFGVMQVRFSCAVMSVKAVYLPRFGMFLNSDL